MCGIAGLLDPRQSRSAETLNQVALDMADALAHRGPDQRGAWCDPAISVALGFRRLAILDLSPAGHQPMQSASSRYVIVFNGEIYNFRELRDGFSGPGAPVWQGHSDTEVLLALIERYGLTRTLPQLDGMFALALWDRKQRQLTLARDRFGEKPLYYGKIAGQLVFASELKSFRSLEGWSRQIDPAGLSQFLRHGWLPSPNSIFEGIAKLPPGSYVTVEAGGAVSSAVNYWSAADAAAWSAERPFAGNEEDALGEAERLIGKSVQRRLVSDVPLGAFLSGGIDSSLVVALMRNGGQPVRSFTIAFPGWAKDEAPHAAAVAKHLGTDHTAVPLTEKDCLDLVPLLPEMYDEPFADPSQLPTALLCRATKPHVTVALSGDGGDELFGGYPRYAAAAREWRRIAETSAPVRHTAGILATLLQGREWRPLRRLRRKLQPYNRTTPELLYRDYLSRWMDEDGLMRRPPPASDLYSVPGRFGEIGSLPLRFMAMDAATYLPDDLETKIDRASMAVSLETRAPLLQADIATFAWSLPMEMKIRPGQGKHLLRQLLYRYVPRDIVDRPKQGFEPPMSEWLRGPLRGWADDLLASADLDCGGLVDPGPIRHRWQEHRSGRRNWAFHLWIILMLQGWLKHEQSLGHRIRMN